MAKWRLNRRTLLRGMVGGMSIGVGLPPLEAMFNATGTAHADGSLIPKRLGIFFWGNGVKVDRWTPANTGAGWTPSLELEPLTPVKDYVSVVSGMEIKSGNERGQSRRASSAARERRSIIFRTMGPTASTHPSTIPRKPSPAYSGRTSCRRTG